ncbi:MAG TPA: hypothetical protein VJX67_09225, partial [Blastocatellia bacterium]|nr:hypothetical protein [Blastocatellia bacterium]
MSIFRSTPRTVWWWSFGLLMAGPAFVLALLGLRSVRAERIEREQQAREEQTQAARLANAGISNALSKIERTLSMLDSAEEYNPPQLFEGHSISYFLIDRAGILTFPGDRVYFGEPPRTGGPANWPANLASLIDQARAAEAQGGKGRAIALYGRIMAAEPKLAAWAEMSLLRLDGKGYWQVLNAILTSESTALTPSGLPAVLVASAALEGASVSERRRYREIIERALSQLRAG